MNSFWEDTYSFLKPYSAFLGGLVYGAGWWLLGDAVTYAMAILHSNFNILWLIPGLVATVAIIVMNTTSKEDVVDSYGDDAAMCRSRVVLMLSYLLSLCAIVGSVALLLSEKQKEEQGDLW
eukprot:CAMPEP_0202897068 /NCGR_PEP_ID=MMETSP1392-20130828/5925_1 /ASSEMBLY_ACC=CAM_ASM_000868 /TAXON_ID=225041 /ORGANISM="Chlamydomonas chlamydogama, Strain SAG 11-48b" /LENGTH=120 /DNA_ID=CAMNT_0049582621 /DNA_START=85 /DNA_END=444 /DNA_ORIENTATION=-